jgi:subtilisin family serine protease
MPTYPVYLNTTYGYPLNYAYLSGTSMATPFVAGVAALTWLTHPGYTNNQIRGILNGTAIDLGTAGWDKYYGYGKVDAYNSVSYALQPPVPEHVTGVLVAVGISAILLMRRFN